jgi:DNA primase
LPRTDLGSLQQVCSQKEFAVPQQSYLEVNGKRVKVSNLEKVLYPATGFTKADVIDYYTRISLLLLPHLKDRPISLKRYPDGVDGFFFYEKQCPSHRQEEKGHQFAHFRDKRCSPPG